MNKDEFYTDLTAYYFTDINRSAVRLKYIKKFLDLRDVDYYSLLTKIINKCERFPTLVDIKKIIGDEPNVLPRISDE